MTPAMTLDRQPGQRVTRGVSRLAVALLACAALWVGPGCGGKPKAGATTPDQGDKSKNPKDMADVGPEMGDNVQTTTVGGDGDQAAGDGDQASGDAAAGEEGAVGDDAFDQAMNGEGDAEQPPPPPEIKPTIVDIPPAEAAARVRTHLDKARVALEGKNKDPNLAISEAKAALAVDPTNTDALAYLAHAYYFRKLDDTAQVLLDMAFYSEIATKQAAARANPRIWYVYGLLYDRAKQPEKAQLFYEGCLKRDPNFVPALINLGVHYLHGTRYADAVKLYEQLTGPLDVRTAVTWTNLGSAYRGRSVSAANTKQQRNEWLLKAETAYKKAIQLDKSYANAYYDLGLLYLDADPFPQGSGNMDMLVRLERAQTYFDEYRKLPGANLELLDERVRVLQKLVKKEQKRRKQEAKKASGEDDDW